MGIAHAQTRTYSCAKGNAITLTVIALHASAFVVPTGSPEPSRRVPDLPAVVRDLSGFQ